MTYQQRRVHLVVWLVMPAVLVALLVAAVVFRPPLHSVSHGVIP